MTILIVSFTIVVSYHILRILNKPRRIILLSLSRCNATIILRYLGQMPNTQIANERLTRINDVQKSVHYNESTIRLPKLEQLCKEANDSFKNNNKIFITHEIAKNVTAQELLWLNKKEWQIIGVVRSPEKQLSSLLDLSQDSANTEYISVILQTGWTNLHYYLIEQKQLLILGIIESTKWCNDILYRSQCFYELDFAYNYKYETLNKYLGDEFYKIDETKNITGINTWNNEAVNSTSIKEDNRKNINENNIKDQDIKILFYNAMTKYDRILKSKNMIN